MTTTEALALCTEAEARYRMVKQLRADIPPAAVQAAFEAWREAEKTLEKVAIQNKAANLPRKQAE